MGDIALPYLTLETAPAIEPLTSSEVKNYLKVDGTDDDALIGNIITVAREVAEKFLKRSLITQTWKMSLDKYAPTKLALPLGPVQSITSVTAFLRDETSSVISSSSYYLNAGKDTLIFDATPVSHRIEVIYVAGFGATAADVPEPIKQGMLTHIAAIYDGRAGGNNIPEQAMALYSGYKTIKF